jgi:hypothetical protein
LGTLDWHYNNTLNQLTKANKTNIIEHYVYDYQGNRARTVVESDHVAGGLLSFSATVVVWVDGEGLLPCVAVCLV